MLNNPNKYVDPDGKDAIYLNDTSGAALSAGHSALLIEDANGEWYYFSFEPLEGDQPFDSAQIIMLKLQNKLTWNDEDTFLENASWSYTGTYIDHNGPGSKDDEEKTVTKNDNINRYDQQIYIKGDFSGSLEKAEKYFEKQPEYSLLSTNCAWVAIDVLKFNNEHTYEERKYFDEILYKKGEFPKMRTVVPNDEILNVKKALENAGYETTHTIYPEGFQEGKIENEGIVTGYNVNFRAGPITDSLVIGKLQRPEKFEMISISGDWWYVKMKEGINTGIVGYIHKDYCFIKE